MVVRFQDIRWICIFQQPTSLKIFRKQLIANLVSAPRTVPRQQPKTTLFYFRVADLGHAITRVPKKEAETERRTCTDIFIWFFSNKDDTVRNLMYTLIGQKFMDRLKHTIKCLCMFCKTWCVQVSVIELKFTNDCHTYIMSYIIVHCTVCVTIMHQSHFF